MFDEEFGSEANNLARLLAFVTKKSGARFRVTRNALSLTIREVLTMFESFRSKESLEEQVREWLIEDDIRILGQSEKSSTIEYVKSLTVSDLVIKVLERTLSEREHAKMLLALSGAATDLGRIASINKAERAAAALAKAHGWLIETYTEGSSVTCSIKK